jgi:hypothetical protein
MFGIAVQSVGISRDTMVCGRQCWIVQCTDTNCRMQPLTERTSTAQKIAVPVGDSHEKDRNRLRSGYCVLDDATVASFCMSCVWQGCVTELRGLSFARPVWLEDPCRRYLGRPSDTWEIDFPTSLTGPTPTPSGSKLNATKLCLLSKFSVAVNKQRVLWLVGLPEQWSGLPTRPAITMFSAVSSKRPCCAVPRPLSMRGVYYRLPRSLWFTILRPEWFIQLGRVCLAILIEIQQFA